MLGERDVAKRNAWQGIAPPLSRLRRDDRGVTIVLVAIVASVLLGFAGLAVETGLWYTIQRYNQSAADAAAISGAMERAAGQADICALAGAAATANNFSVTSCAAGACTNPFQGQICVNNPPLFGDLSVTSDPNAVEVILPKPQSALFSSLWLPSALNGVVMIDARAVAHSDAACVLTLANITFAGSSVSLNPSNCSIETNSTSSTSLVFNGNASLIAFTIVTSGDYSTGGATVTLTKPARKHAAATADPYATASHAMPPLASCLPSTSMPTPGNCYQGISITGSYTFSPGVYYVAGSGSVNTNSFAISGTVNGTGVTIVLFNGANVDISGTAIVSLSAPTSGTWKGILFWQDNASTPCPACTSESFTGGSASNYTGALYFPHGNVDFGGNSGSSCTVLIANTVTFDGTPTMDSSGCAAIGVTPPINTVLLE
jgi:hypothetical protein